MANTTKSSANLNWAVKMADSIMERTPRLYDDKGYQGKWSYDYGVILKGFELLWKQTYEAKYYHYIQENMDYFIGEDGSVKGYLLKNTILIISITESCCSFFTGKQARRNTKRQPHC